MSPLDVVPLPWRLGAVALLIVAAGGFGYMQGVKHEGAQRDIADAVTTRATDAAILARVASNTVDAARQHDINAAITKGTNEALNPVVAAISTSRLLIGPAICGGRPAAPGQTESAGSSNAADPGSGRDFEGVERDIKALEIRVETALAAGRACQAFIRENGMSPD